MEYTVWKRDSRDFKHDSNTDVMLYKGTTLAVVLELIKNNGPIYIEEKEVKGVKMEAKEMFEDLGFSLKTPAVVGVIQYDKYGINDIHNRVYFVESNNKVMVQKETFKGSEDYEEFEPSKLLKEAINKQLEEFEKSKGGQ